MWATRGPEVGPLLSLPKKALEIKVERTGIEPVTSGLRKGRAAADSVAALENLIDRLLYFTVAVKHSLVRTVPSVPTTRKLRSNFAPSTNRGGPRRTS